MEILVTRIWEVGSSTDDDCITLSISDDANMGVKLRIPRYVANLLIGYLSAESGILEAARAPDADDIIQHLPVTRVETEACGDTAVMFLYLDTGAVIPLRLGTDALASLSAALALQGATASQRPN